MQKYIKVHLVPINKLTDILVHVLPPTHRYVPTLHKTKFKKIQRARFLKLELALATSVVSVSFKDLVLLLIGLFGSNFWKYHINTSPNSDINIYGHSL